MRRVDKGALPGQRKKKVMNRSLLSFNVCITVVTCAFGYEEWSVPNVTAPTLIKPFGLEVQFQHQFLGRIDGKDKFDRFFGMGDGADANIALRAIVWSTAQVSVSYDNTQTFNLSTNEFTVGTSYAVTVPWVLVHIQADGQFFSYSSYETFPAERRNGFFVQCALQNDPLFGRVAGLADVGYDFDKKAFGLGLGLDIKVIGALDVYGEYFPVVDKKVDPLLPERTVVNPYSLGVKMTTAGHQFFIFLGNAVEIGSRHLMRGAPDNNLKLGFQLKRLFKFPYPWF